MRTVLLDTNIIIERENPKVPNQSVAGLFKILDKEKVSKYIHPSCFDELEKYHDKKQVAILNAKLEAYNLIDIPNINSDEFNHLMKDTSNSCNDSIDNQLLFQVFSNRVDLLITEDKKMLQKANILKIRSKVFTIDEYVHLHKENNPKLIEYPVLSVKKEKFKNIDIYDEFFDYFRKMYPDFNNWFNKKFDEDAYIVNSELGLEGFLYIKTESIDEPYGHFSKPFPPKKRLKIGTFKVVSNGYRLGERFIKIIIDNALERNVDEIYVTIFKNEASAKPLVSLLESWGFLEYCMNNQTNESVMIKDMRKYNKQKSPKFNFPLLCDEVKHFFLPIEQHFHKELFPDSALYRELIQDNKKPHQYALQKTYISFAYSATNAKPGDILLIYRNGDPYRAAYTGVISTITVVEKVVQIESLEHLLSECENRTVFAKEQLIKYFNTQKPIFVVKLLHRHTLERKIILKQLWDMKIITPPSGPRPFDLINATKYEEILGNERGIHK